MSALVSVRVSMQADRNMHEPRAANAANQSADRKKDVSHLSSGWSTRLALRASCGSTPPSLQLSAPTADLLMSLIAFQLICPSPPSQSQSAVDDEH